jgi:predicted nucleotidyltransferase
MRGTDAIHTLRRYSDALRARGATALFLFGSTVRDEAGPSSDLDLFIDYDPAQKFSLIDLVAIKHFLEDELDRPIDLTTRDSLHPMLRATIESEAVRVF